mmetsp:Transcript_135991/g.290694  ORF Transcript_135991/g.290694 Transcript_135991/m.290694 type:complete len:246 (-) Transcript_135991:136-873(-)
MPGNMVQRKCASQEAPEGAITTWHLRYIPEHSHDLLVCLGHVVAKSADKIVISQALGATKADLRIVMCVETSVSSRFCEVLGKHVENHIIKSQLLVDLLPMGHSASAKTIYSMILPLDALRTPCRKKSFRWVPRKYSHAPTISPRHSAWVDIRKLFYRGSVPGLAIGPPRPPIGMIHKSVELGAADLFDEAECKLLRRPQEKSIGPVVCELWALFWIPVLSARSNANRGEFCFLDLYIGLQTVSD